MHVGFYVPCCSCIEFPTSSPLPPHWHTSTESVAWYSQSVCEKVLPRRPLKRHREDLGSQDLGLLCTKVTTRLLVSGRTSLVKSQLRTKPAFCYLWLTNKFERKAKKKKALQSPTAARPSLCLMRRKESSPPPLPPSLSGNLSRAFVDPECFVGIGVPIQNM